jgi:hypothetical protein
MDPRILKEKCNMKTKNKPDNKKAIETFGEMLHVFGTRVGEVLDDPEVKEKATELMASIVDAAAKVNQSKVQNENVRAKLRSIGKAAQTLGCSLDEHFKDEPEGKC